MRSKSAHRALFETGQICSTPGALEAIPPAEVLAAIGRHIRGDWGDVCPEDAAENELALDKYLRLFSVYHSGNGTKFWVITEADRSLTTVLLPDEY